MYIYVFIYTYMPSAAHRKGNNLQPFKDFNQKDGSSQGQNLALTVVLVPSSLD